MMMEYDPDEVLSCGCVGLCECWRKEAQADPDARPGGVPAFQHDDEGQGVVHG